MADCFCQACGTGIQDWDTAFYARNMFCITCYQAKQRELSRKPCGRCGVPTSKDELKFFRDKYLCPYCHREAEQEVHDKECAFCKKWIEGWEEKFKLPDGHYICKLCHDKSRSKFGVCTKCGKLPSIPFVLPDGVVLCEVCAIKSRQADSGQKPLLARAIAKLGRILSA